MKRYANHRIRHKDDIPDGNAYRKFTDPWDICDFKCMYDPKPSIYWRKGVQEIIEPSPIWQVARK